MATTWIDLGNRDSLEVVRRDDGEVEVSLYHTGLRAGAFYGEGSFTLTPAQRDALVAALTTSPEEEQAHA